MTRQDADRAITELYQIMRDKLHNARTRKQIEINTANSQYEQAVVAICDQFFADCDEIENELKYPGRIILQTTSF